MLSFVLLAVVSVLLARAQEGEIDTPDNKAQCINQMLQWCDSMQYPQQGAGMTMMSIAYGDPTGYYRVLCVTDSDGTNCTRNNSLWFACTPDHKLSYKGQVLTKTSTDVDDDICETADKAFNQLFLQQISHNNFTLSTEFQMDIQSFFEQMAAMEEQITELKKRLSNVPAFGGDFWNGFGDDFPFRRPDVVNPDPSDSGKRSTEDTNQIEKE